MPENSFVDELLQQDRVLISAELHLANGSFFQPTGFPDIGACVYTDGAGQRRCLVESEQSMANRLEAVCMKAPGVWREPLAGKLPVVCVRSKQDGPLIATNLTEPHRVASSYVLEGTINGTNSQKGSKLQEKLKEQIGLDDKTKAWPLDKRDRLSQAVFSLDPPAILHGFQFMQWETVGLRAARLLHARLEAVLTGDGELHYGLVKVDGIEPESSAKKKSNKGQSIGVKTRYVSESIQATFEIDVLALRERSLIRPFERESTGDVATNTNQGAQRFLLALALWKIHRFLTNGPAFDARTGETMGALRLRTDCSLAVGRVNWSGSRQGIPFGQHASLDLERLVKPLSNDGDTGLLAAPPNFEELLRPLGLGLETTVIYGG